MADALQQQGLYIKSPRVEFLKKVDFIDDQSFFSAKIIGKKRNLVDREITIIFASLRQNIIGSALIAGFGQVSKSKELRDYFLKGRDLAWKKVKELNKFFTDQGIPIPSTADSFVTNSNIPPFSEKLMLYQVIMLHGASIMQDGIGISQAMRHDLSSHFSASMLETGKYAEDGLELITKNKWMEQPPIALSNADLAEV